MRIAKVEETTNLIEMLEYRVNLTPDDVAVRFLPRGEISEESISLSFIELHRRAQSIAVRLLQQGSRGDRVLLLFDAGIEFITGFWGCVYAGMIAIPLPPPKTKKLDSLNSIVADADPTIILSQETVKQRLYPAMQNQLLLCQIPWLIEDDHHASSHFPDQMPSADDVVFLQYTSGSTGSPKGVMVSHQNLLANQLAMKTIWQNDESSVIVSWLPHYHDMGLIGIILQSLYSGATLVLMSPVSFIQKPVRWLQAISHFGGTNSGAPNFAYESCLRTISDQALSNLNLNTWRTAWNGAEPIHADTLYRFGKRFSGCGFDIDYITPSYGLAEGTLIVSTANAASQTPLLSLDNDQLKRGKVNVISSQPLSLQQPVDSNAELKWGIGCGYPIPGHEVAIVSPNTQQRCNANEVGEIWFAGPSVAKGYWQNAEATAETFHATFTDPQSNIEKGPYLRTGDLGFLHTDGQVYVVGRHKDMMIFHGENYAPQDIERTVALSDDAFVKNSTAAFSVIANGEERLVVVQEVKRSARRAIDTHALLGSIQASVAENHQLPLFALVLINEANLPKTSSGKVQRRLSKVLFINDNWNALFKWQQSEIDADQLLDPSATFHNKRYGQIEPDSLSANSLSTKQLIGWISDWMKRNLNGCSVEFDEENRFVAFGMDSQTSARMIYELAQHTGIELEASLCWSYPCPRDLALYVTEQLQGECA
ncbi:AMP-binding protein [Veronia pacifica]|uniref:Polyketide synthase-like phosphopantetheine-binding domain-containing protein n=1 Tax=Veronia pacifica TaxID=1080227 RepID=A0A1C3EMD2_9GAMM|nr:AMP-binding protein [Veronia pacifica]ODA34379.1 hypothetical protein A8L45_06550 [Veronia pacifica]